MRITFLALGWENLSVSLLSALAKEQGHQVSLAFSAALFDDRYNLHVPSLAKLFDDRRQVLKTILRQQPDVLACSVLTSTYQWMLAMAGDVKKILPQTKVIFGGVHPSAVPERVLSRPEVDFVCVGEGDMAFGVILETVRFSQWGRVIPNTRYKLPDGKIVRGPQMSFIQDLDALPIFDKTLWEEYINLKDIYFTMASRGCPYQKKK